jgi:hypothetical protein
MHHTIHPVTPKSVDLQEVSLEDLQKELERRRAIQEAERKQRIQAHRQLIRDNIDLILQLQPEHGRTSCSDEKPYNTGRCWRCDLLEIKSGVPSDLDVTLEFSYGEEL